MKTIIDEYGGWKIGRAVIYLDDMCNTFVRRVHPFVLRWYDPGKTDPRYVHAGLAPNAPVGEDGKPFVETTNPPVKPGQIKTYRLIVYRQEQTITDHRTEEMQFDLDPIWDNISVGYFHVCIFGEDENGELKAISYVRSFYKAADFTGEVLPAKLDYREASKLALQWLFDFKPDMTDPHNQKSVYAPQEPIFLNHSGVSYSSGAIPEKSYPETHFWGYIRCFAEASRAFAESAPDLSQRCLQLAEQVADRAIKYSTPADFAYPHLIAQTVFRGQRGIRGWGNPEERLAENTHLITPPHSGTLATAYLDLHQLTGKEKYFDAAVRIAETLRQHQKDDGSWPYHVNAKTGEVYFEYTSLNSLAAVFFDRLIRSYPRLAGEYQQTRDRAWQWVFDEPLKHWRWENQFPDGPEYQPYEDIGAADAYLFGQYLLEAYGDDPEMVRVADEIRRFVEDNFIYFKPDHFACFYRMGMDIVALCPCAGEQYKFPFVMTWGTAEWAKLCHRLWRATGDESYLRRAQAGLSAITYHQADEGFVLTFSMDRITGQTGHAGDSVWFGCLIPPVMAWLEASETKEKAHP